MNKVYRFLLIYFCLFSSMKVFASDSKSGLPQLDFSTYPSLIFWSLISLILLYLLTNYLITPKISNSLNKREQNIRNDLMKAKSLKEESDKILHELEQKQNDAKNKAKDLINNTHNETKIYLEKIEKDLLEKTNLKILESIKKIESEKNKNVSILLKNVSDISSTIIKKVTKIEINNSRLNKTVQDTSNLILKDKKNGI